MALGSQDGGHDPRIQMPVNDHPVSWCAHLNRFPMTLFEPHADQAYRNHGQSLQRLSERGGLNWSEALAILEDRDWRKCDDAEDKFRALASGIETEGHDRAAGRGAEHESPTAESGDAQNIAQDIGGPSQ